MAAKPAGKLPASPTPPIPAPKAAKATKGASTPATKEKAHPKTPPKTKRKRPDRDAVERDYRTGKFTLRELEAKHGVSYAQISRWAKDSGWTKDLRDVIKQATDAAVLRETVTQAQKDATETVLVAAELNKQVILGHREDIKAARNLTFELMQELKEARLLAQEKEALANILVGPDNDDDARLDRARGAVRKALDIHARISSAKSLAETFTKLQAMERTAFNLDDAPPPANDPLTDLLHEIASGNTSSFKPVQDLPPDDED